MVEYLSTLPYPCLYLMFLFFWVAPSVFTSICAIYGHNNFEMTSGGGSICDVRPPRPTFPAGRFSALHSLRLRAAIGRGRSRIVSLSNLQAGKDRPWNVGLELHPLSQPLSLLSGDDDLAPGDTTFPRNIVLIGEVGPPEDPAFGEIAVAQQRGVGWEGLREMDLGVLWETGPIGCLQIG